MPNWSSVYYKIEGEEQSLKKIKTILDDLSSGKIVSEKNDFGNLWLGNLVSALGGDWHEIPCRGSIYDYYMLNGRLNINFEVAWSDSVEFREFLEETFDNKIQVFFSQREPGLEIYETNNFDLFPTRYIVFWDIPYYGDEDEYTDLQELEEDAKDRLGLSYMPQGIESIVDAVDDKINSMDQDKDLWGERNLVINEVSLVID